MNSRNLNWSSDWSHDHIGPLSLPSAPMELYTECVGIGLSHLTRRKKLLGSFWESPLVKAITPPANSTVWDCSHHEFLRPVGHRSTPRVARENRQKSHFCHARVITPSSRPHATTDTRVRTTQYLLTRTCSHISHCSGNPARDRAQSQRTRQKHPTFAETTSTTEVAKCHNMKPATTAELTQRPQQTHSEGHEVRRVNNSTQPNDRRDAQSDNLPPSGRKLMFVVSLLQTKKSTLAW